MCPACTHTSWVPAHWSAFDASTDLSTDLSGMRSCTSVLYSCSSQHCSKHHSWLWVILDFNSFSPKQPTTSIHEVPKPVSCTTITVLSLTQLPTLQPVAQDQQHPSVLYPAAYTFHPLAPHKKLKGKFLAASTNLTSWSLSAQRDNNYGSSQDTISSRQGKSGNPDS